MYLINKISFLFNYFSVNTEAQPFSLPMSVTSAIIELKTQDVIGFKVILSKEKAQFARISVNKLKEGSITKYLFSGFYKNIKFTKFFNYEDLIQNLRAITIFKRNPELKEDMPFELLEKNFIESESISYKEYILDFIYKHHPEELFGFKEIVLTDKNIYIKKYYLKLLELFFNYVDYDELVDAYNDLENLYIENADLEELKNSLIGKIQEKNVIEAQMEDLGINSTSSIG